MASHDVNKEIKAYWAVFTALLVFTAITVGLSFIWFVPSVGIILGLAVALTKGTLVACIFMHLKAERRLIYWSLFLTVVFFFAVILLPLWTELDGISHKTDFPENGGFYHGTALPEYVDHHADSGDH